MGQMSKSYSPMTSSSGVSDWPSVNFSLTRQSDPVPSCRGGGGKGVGKGKVKGGSGVQVSQSASRERTQYMRSERKTYTATHSVNIY